MDAGDARFPSGNILQWCMAARARVRVCVSGVRAYQWVYVQLRDRQKVFLAAVGEQQQQQHHHASSTRMILKAGQHSTCEQEKRWPYLIYIC